MAAAVYLLTISPQSLQSKGKMQKIDLKNPYFWWNTWSTGTSSRDFFFLHSNTHKNTGNNTQKSIDPGQCELLGEQAKTLK